MTRRGTPAEVETNPDVELQVIEPELAETEPLAEQPSPEEQPNDPPQNEDPGEAPESTPEAPAPRVPRNPERCITVKADPARFRLICTTEEGSYIREEFAEIVRPPEGSAPEGAELLPLLASMGALAIANHARQRDIEVIRVQNSELGDQLAARLEEADFYVVPFPG